MNTKLIRTIHPEVRVISEQDGTIDYVASDETLDHYREIIKASGWRFDHFKKNAPFVDSHDTSQIERQIGRVESFVVRDGKLIERVKYAIDVPACVLAKFAFDMVAKGYIKAVSVGFIPEQTTCRNDAMFTKLVEEMKLDAGTIASLRCIYVQHQQIELSQCIIGANPNALAKAFKDGAATEEQMAAIGFGDSEAMDFLQLGADAEIRGALADPLIQALYRRECQRLFISSSATRRGPSRTDPSPRSSAGGEASQQRDKESRNEFLRKLKSVAGL